MTNEVVTLLLRIEWQGDQTHYVCPYCRQSRMHGHAKGCELAKVIASSTTPAESK